jgi:hypothetical protein
MFSRNHMTVLVAAVLAIFCARIGALHVTGFSSFIPVAQDCGLSSSFVGASFQGNAPPSFRKPTMPVAPLIFTIICASVAATCSQPGRAGIFRRTVTHPVLGWGLAAGTGGQPPDGGLRAD